MRIFIRALFIALLPALFTGCVSTVKETGFLEHGYSDFNVVENKDLRVRVIDPENWEEPVVFAAFERELAVQREGEHFMVRPASLGDNFREQVTAHPVVFIIPEPIWLVDDPYPGEPEKTDELTFTVRERLYRYLLRKYPHPTRVRYGCSRNDPKFKDHRFVTIQTYVTWYDKGIGFTRYILGWGIGQAGVQIEGDFIDGFVDDGKKIGEFAVRTQHGGFAQNGINVNVLKSNYCLKYASEEAIRMLTDQIPNIIPGISYRLHGELPEIVREVTERPSLDLAAN